MQSEKIEENPPLFDPEPEENIPTGLFITYDQFEKAKNASVRIEFNGEIFKIIK